MSEISETKQAVTLGSRRTILPNARAYDRAGTGDHSLFSNKHCCVCGRACNGRAAWLLLARAMDGTREFAISSPEDATDEERDYSMWIAPIGSDCLRKHPELAHAVIVFGSRASVVAPQGDAEAERRSVLNLIKRFQREDNHLQATINALEWLRRQIAEGNHVYHKFEQPAIGFAKPEECARCGLPGNALMHLLAGRAAAPVTAPVSTGDKAWLCSRRPWPCRYPNARQCAHDTMLGDDCPKVCECECHDRAAATSTSAAIRAAVEDLERENFLLSDVTPEERDQIATILSRYFGKGETEARSEVDNVGK